MQNPFTSASVGNGSASSVLKASQPRRTMASASSALPTLLSSSTSAPAMKPESLPELMTSPLGFPPRNSSSTATNSAITSPESVFADAPALSNVSQAILSL